LSYTFYCFLRWTAASSMFLCDIRPYDQLVCTRSSLLLFTASQRCSRSTTSPSTWHGMADSSLHLVHQAVAKLTYAAMVWWGFANACGLLSTMSLSYFGGNRVHACGVAQWLGRRSVAGGLSLIYA